MPSCLPGAGAFPCPGVRMLLPDRAPDGRVYLTVRQAAEAAGVKPPAVRRWERLGYLTRVATDSRGHAIHELSAVLGAEKLARDAAVRTSGCDKRARRSREAA